MQLGGTSVRDASRCDDENGKAQSREPAPSQKITEQDGDEGKKKWRRKSEGR